jgi:general secretion pathway protein K
MSWPSQQRGAAILTAMLTVVLVATLASAMLWQQWRSVEIESAQRTRVQSAWILTGALDWARMILREDARQGGADHLGEPWAVPLAPARLSTFLSAERGEALVSDEIDSSQDAFLAGYMQDQQARLNLSNLLSNGQLHEPTRFFWERLFRQLNLPESELQRLLLNLQSASDWANPAPDKSPSPLRPQTVADLAWLGVSSETLQVLQPFITLLPERTPVNLNTASAEVLLACIVQLDKAQARKLVDARAIQPMKTLDDAKQLLGDARLQLDSTEHVVASRFFSVTGQLRVGHALVQEQSLLQRDGMQVKTLSRKREVLGSTQPLLQ